MDYRDIITIEPGKRGGTCIRRMRNTVYDVLGWLAAPNVSRRNFRRFSRTYRNRYYIKACLAFALQ